mgnify:CR=1 FL=1
MSEIIIDGVNVAGCEFLENDEFDCLCLQISDRYEVQTGCKNKDCYYKQLKRLKAVLKEALKQLEFSRTHKTVLDAERIKYKQALEEIREILNKECGVISNAKVVGIINEALND